jgi:hypothetical protein
MEEIKTTVTQRDHERLFETILFASEGKNTNIPRISYCLKRQSELADEKT